MKEVGRVPLAQSAQRLEQYTSQRCYWARGMLKLGRVGTHGTMAPGLFQKQHFKTLWRRIFTVFLRYLYAWVKVQKSRPKFTPVTLGVALEVSGSAHWNRLSKCWILSIISIFDLEMTRKVTSGWAGSTIFRLAVVDIPIQRLTPITLRHRIRALYSWVSLV